MEEQQVKRRRSGSSKDGTTLTPEEKQAAVNLKDIFYKVAATNKRLSQRSAASHLKMTQPAVNQYLNGLIPLNVTATLAFAEMLGCDPSEIYPQLHSKFDLAKYASRVKLYATVLANGKITTNEIRGMKELQWTAPIPNAWAIQLDTDMSDTCPRGTLLVFDNDRVMTVEEIERSTSNGFVVTNVSDKKYSVYPCRLDRARRVLVFIQKDEHGDEEVIVDLSNIGKHGRPLGGMKVHPLIAKMCVSGADI